MSESLIDSPSSQSSSDYFHSVRGNIREKVESSKWLSNLRSEYQRIKEKENALPVKGERCLVCTLPQGTCEHTSDWLVSFADEREYGSIESQIAEEDRLHKSGAVRSKVGTGFHMRGDASSVAQSSTRTSLTEYRHQLDPLKLTQIDALQSQAPQNDVEREIEDALGFMKDSEVKVDHVISSAVIEDINLDGMMWSRLEQRPSDRIGATNTSLFAPDERGWHSAVSMADKFIVLFGGLKYKRRNAIPQPFNAEPPLPSEIEYLDDLLVYDSSNVSWHGVRAKGGDKHMQTGISYTNPSDAFSLPSPIGRYGHVAASLDDNRMLVFGGRGAGGKIFGDTWVYYFDRDCWVELSATTRTGTRARPTGAEESADIHQQDGGGGTSDTLIGRATVKVSTGKAGLTSPVHRSGGEDDFAAPYVLSMHQQTSSAFAHSRGGGREEEVGHGVRSAVLPHAAEGNGLATVMVFPSPQPRYFSSCASVGEDVYLFGGTDGVDNFGDLWCFRGDKHLLKWERLLAVGLPPSPRYGHCLVRLGEEVPDRAAEKALEQQDLRISLTGGMNATATAVAAAREELRRHAVRLCVVGGCAVSPQGEMVGSNFSTKETKSLLASSSQLQKSYLREGNFAQLAGAALEGNILYNVSNMALDVRQVHNNSVVQSLLHDTQNSARWISHAHSDAFDGGDGKADTEVLSGSVRPNNELPLREMYHQAASTTAALHEIERETRENERALVEAWNKSTALRTYNLQKARHPTAELEVMFFDTGENMWKPQLYPPIRALRGDPANMPLARIHCGAACIADHLFVVGGVEPTSMRYKHVEGATGDTEVFGLNLRTFVWSRHVPAHSVEHSEMPLRIAEADIIRANKRCAEEKARGMALGASNGRTVELAEAEAVLEVCKWRKSMIERERDAHLDPFASPSPRFGASLVRMGSQQRLVYTAGWTPTAAVPASDHLSMVLNLEQEHERRRRLDDEFRARLERDRIREDAEVIIARVQSVHELRAKLLAEKAQQERDKLKMAFEDLLSSLPPLSIAPSVRLRKTNQHTMWVTWDRVTEGSDRQPVNPSTVTYMLYMKSGYENLLLYDRVSVAAGISNPNSTDLRALKNSKRRSNAPIRTGNAVNDASSLVSYQTIATNSLTVQSIGVESVVQELEQYPGDVDGSPGIFFNPILPRYKGEIVRICGRGYFDVVYDDGAFEKNVHRSRLRRLPPIVGPTTSYTLSLSLSQSESQSQLHSQSQHEKESYVRTSPPGSMLQTGFTSATTEGSAKGMLTNRSTEQSVGAATLGAAMRKRLQKRQEKKSRALKRLDSFRSGNGSVTGVGMHSFAASLSRSLPHSQSVAQSRPLLEGAVQEFGGVGFDRISRRTSSDETPFRNLHNPDVRKEAMEAGGDLKASGKEKSNVPVLSKVVGVAMTVAPKSALKRGVIDSDARSAMSARSVSILSDVSLSDSESDASHHGGDWDGAMGTRASSLRNGGDKRRWKDGEAGDGDENADLDADVGSLRLSRSNSIGSEGTSPQSENSTEGRISGKCLSVSKTVASNAPTNGASSYGTIPKATVTVNPNDWTLVYIGNGTSYTCPGLVPQDALSPENEPDLVVPVAFVLQTHGCDFPEHERSQLSERSIFYTRLPAICTPADSGIGYINDGVVNDDRSMGTFDGVTTDRSGSLAQGSVCSVDAADVIGVNVGAGGSLISRTKKQIVTAVIRGQQMVQIEQLSNAYSSQGVAEEYI